MDTLTGMAAFFLLIVVLVYGYLKLRDWRLRRAGATAEQLRARSQMTVQNVRGSWAGLVGAFFVLSGVWSLVEKHLNGEAVPWFKGGLVIILGVWLLGGAASRLSSAVKLKRFSKGKFDE